MPGCDAPWPPFFWCVNCALGCASALSPTDETASRHRSPVTAGSAKTPIRRRPISENPKSALGWGGLGPAVSGGLCGRVR
jgi:hypothetical protein